MDEAMRAALVNRWGAGERPELLFFWGHTPREPEVVDRACCSQWFPRAFTVEGVRYPTAEHWMMAAKARCFDDEQTLARIVLAATPAEVKALGRSVQGFDEHRWAERRFAAVVEGNLAKFGQHADLRAFLLGTGRAVLVEASPHDQVWGIGLAANDPRAKSPAEWLGLNLLGFALTEVRRRLATPAAA